MTTAVFMWARLICLDSRNTNARRGRSFAVLRMSATFRFELAKTRNRPLSLYRRAVAHAVEGGKWVVNKA
jgi:hypothetical protein